MTCAACSGSIEKHFLTGGGNNDPIPGIQKISVSLLTNKALIQYDPNIIKPREIISEI
jgi:copper chaperone CopZ